MGFQNLADVHAGRYAKRIQDDVNCTPIRHKWHVFRRRNFRDHAFIAVAPCHLVARLQTTLDGQVDLDHFGYARLQIIALRELSALFFKRLIKLLALGFD
jgi:hypothetical protein